MNVLATKRGSAHYPSMLEDVDAQRQTEIELITGSLVREAERQRRARAAALAAVRARQRKGSIVAGNPGTDRRAEMTKVGKAALALVAVAVVAVAVVGGGSAAAAGDASRSAGRTTASGAMAPFDGPALATAKSHDRGRSTRRSSTKLQLITCNTQGNKPAIAKACAREAARPGRRRRS